MSRDRSTLQGLLYKLHDPSTSGTVRSPNLCRACDYVFCSRHLKSDTLSHGIGWHPAVPHGAMPHR